ncbi:hypothetical protein B0T11DRAFT_347245 [Plectosphaerella cucumerina]|uniref:Fe2OG dioxygenase domain-containing protein n=1 Tax=Plectosphaerella cucumerina TaxID=40658 RepID=A0A8K0TWC9_9PEZI|nr:hypothetical protein B0T11DRAFT_347245 [Plectosphaerella cucumerina]
MSVQVAQPRAAPVVVGSLTQRATRPVSSPPQWMIDEAKTVEPESFNPEKHIAFQKPESILSMKEIGLEGCGVSINAASAPFNLFSHDAIRQMRREIFSEQVLKECQYSSTFNKNMVRGMNHERAPFTYDAWNSPELLAKLSSVAGIDVVPHIDFEIANINITWDGQTKTVVSNPGSTQEPNGSPESAVAWHFDSMPFVCVVMLSDCADMVGGETALKLPNGEIKKVRGPSMGTAVLMQGRYIEHQALKAIGGKERITMVTCLRPKNPLTKDETVLTGVRGISTLPELYEQYTEYRLQILKERMDAKIKEEKHRREGKQKVFDVDEVRAFLSEQRDFLDSMLTELI